MSLRGEKLEEWLDAKRGYVLKKKQKSQKKIGQLRHLAFDKLLYDRYVKEEWWGCDIDYLVFDIAMEDIDAIVYDNRNYIPFEVYELTNYGKYRALAKGEKAIEFISPENAKRHIKNLTRFNCERYVVISFPENLKDEVLWEYAKNGIRIKVLGYQD